MAIVIPCFWQPIVSGVDLQSHLYNAWLAELIRRGSIHGLWIGHQSTNILVDLLLAWLMNNFGVSVAERVITASLILVFFWGAFLFISAVRGQVAYWLAPWLAILSYGYIFQMGFLNYYLASGIVLWLFALLWWQHFGWRALWAAPLLILSWFAHPLPVLWFLCVAAYCWLAQRMRRRFQLLLFVGSVAAIFLLRGYIVARYVTNRRVMQLMVCTGADQSYLYGWHYLPVTIGFLLFSVVLLGEPENRWRAVVSVLGQTYLLTAITIIVMPSEIRASLDNASSGQIAFRLSLFSGVLLLAVLSRSAYRRWYLSAGLLTAAIFFSALYYDVGREARIEAKMEQLVETLPPGQRVISFADLPDGEGGGSQPTKEGKLANWTQRIMRFGGERLALTHLASRACIGHCFDYINYEPETGQFRIHAVPGNPFVVATNLQIRTMLSKSYMIKASDLPLYALIRWGPGSNDLFIRPLTKGESVATLAYHGRLFRDN
jgi:hypothetical protein